MSETVGELVQALQKVATVLHRRRVAPHALVLLRVHEKDQNDALAQVLVQVMISTSLDQHDGGMYGWC